MSRYHICLVASQVMKTMVTPIIMPMMGSRMGKPMAVPNAANSTASEVRPSVRACRPSATSAAEPILRPARIWSSATISLPRKPMMAAAASQPRLLNGCGFKEALERLPQNVGSAKADGDDDKDAGHVFGTRKAEIVAPVGAAPRQIEGDEQRNRVEAVADVVDGVAQQGHAAAEEDDKDLQDRRKRQQPQCNPDRANAQVVVQKCLIRGQLRLLMAVAVQMKDGRYPAPKPAAMVVMVTIAVIMVVIMVVIVRVIMVVVMTLSWSCRTCGSGCTYPVTLIGNSSCTWGCGCE